MYVYIYVIEHCSSGLQCYDAFGTQGSASNSNSNNHSYTETNTTYISIGAAIAGLLVGVFVTQRYSQWTVTKNRKKSTATGRPTVFDRVVPSGHLDFEEQYESLTTPFANTEQP